MTAKDITLLQILFAVPAALFWVVYFLPWSGGENWFPVLAWFYIAPVCLILLAPILYFAVKRNDLFWWLTLGFDALPVFKTIADFLLAIVPTRNG